MGQFPVGRRRRDRILLTAQAIEAVAVQRGPRLVLLSSFGVHLPSSPVLGHETTAQGLAPALGQVFASNSTAVGRGPKAPLAGLQPGKIDAAALADGFQLAVVEVGSRLQGQKDQTPPVGSCPGREGEPANSRDIGRVVFTDLGGQAVRDEPVLPTLARPLCQKRAPLPFQGSEEEVTEGQITILETAQKSFDSSMEQEEEFRDFVLAFPPIAFQMMVSFFENSISHFIESYFTLLIIQD